MVEEWLVMYGKKAFVILAAAALLIVSAPAEARPRGQQVDLPGVGYGRVTADGSFLVCDVKRDGVEVRLLVPEPDGFATYVAPDAVAPKAGDWSAKDACASGNVGASVDVYAVCPFLIASLGQSEDSYEHCEFGRAV